MINNKQKAILHIAKAQLGLSDEEYRMILRTHGGAESSKYLDDLGCERVMRFFGKLGFRRSRGKKDFTILATAGQRKVIWHLAEDLQWIPKRLFGFIFKMTGKRQVEELTRKEAMKVTEGLKALRNRGVKWN